jgi:two-component sensor histidine kinase
MRVPVGAFPTSPTKTPSDRNRLRADGRFVVDTLVTALPPYSAPSIGVAVLCFASALLLQIAFRAVGGSLMFATYFPAVLVAGLISGFPAGIFVTLAALLTVWWAFIPPQWAFFPLSPDHLINIATYLFSSGCILFVTERFREILRQVREHERQRDLLTKELEHRSKNTYAVIDAIVRKTLEDDQNRANILSGRIRAVKFANDALSHSASHTVLLKTILLQEFMPYGEIRFHADGADIELSGDTARHLTLVFHELVTNAAKYGALSRPGGRVLIAWKNEDPTHVTLEWREEGGPQVSGSPKQGFGSYIMTKSLQSLSGSIAPVFAPDGLRCSIKFSLESSMR